MKKLHYVMKKLPFSLKILRYTSRTTEEKQKI